MDCTPVQGVAGATTGSGGWGGAPFPGFQAPWGGAQGPKHPSALSP